MFGNGFEMFGLSVGAAEEQMALETTAVIVTDKMIMGLGVIMILVVLAVGTVYLTKVKGISDSILMDSFDKPVVIGDARTFLKAARESMLPDVVGILEACVDDIDMLFGYIEGHGRELVMSDASWYLRDVEAASEDLKAVTLTELVEQVQTWNSEFIEDVESELRGDTPESPTQIEYLENRLESLRKEEKVLEQLVAQFRVKGV